MIKFIVTGLPRSGTTWLSVFLTTDDCVCLHDPSVTHSPKELEEWEGGIADTGVWFLPKWCSKNTQKIVTIDRNIDEVNSSLTNKGIPKLPDFVKDEFEKRKLGLIIYYEDLFSQEIAEEIWNYVYPEKPFNVYRWELLKDIYMSPKYMEN